MQNKWIRRSDLEKTILLLFCIGRYNRYNQQIFPTYFASNISRREPDRNDDHCNNSRRPLSRHSQTG